MSRAQYAAIVARQRQINEQKLKDICGNQVEPVNNDNKVQKTVSFADENQQTEKKS